MINQHLVFQDLVKHPNEINSRASDMWSYAVLLWELATREIPFGDIHPMELGMKVQDLFFLLIIVQCAFIFVYIGMIITVQNRKVPLLASANIRVAISG